MIVKDGAVTVKLLPLVAVFPATVTVMVPVDAPDGTVVVMLVEELAVTVANVPLKRTVLSVGVALKFVPVMVTVVPMGPLAGVKLKIESTVTIKLLPLVAVFPATVTAIVPVDAPAGTVVVRLVAELAVTVANVPLKRRVLSVVVVLKFVPVIVTVVPMGPLAGVKVVMVGELMVMLPLALTRWA